MGLWNFFRKGRNKERLKETIEKQSNQDESFQTGDLEEQKVDFNSREESASYLQNCCERIIE